jgi:2-haloacid dehalogenase
MRRAIVFDVNETLLDLGALDPSFERAFGDSFARREWFSMLLRAAFTASLTDRYRPFGELARDALASLADSRSATPREHELAEILDAMAALPAHPDVERGLDRLADAGYRLATLTNSSPELAERQLESAGVRDRFDRVLTVEPVRRFKPAPAVYAYAAEQLGHSPQELLMVAAHDWDLHGARSAGMEVAYVERPGMAFQPRRERPVLAGKDLIELAELIVASGE